MSSSQRKKHSEDEICLSSDLSSKEPINIEILEGRCESANSFESVSENDESYYAGLMDDKSNGKKESDSKFNLVSSKSLRVKDI